MTEHRVSRILARSTAALSLLISSAAFAQVVANDAQNPAQNPAKDSVNPGQAPLDQLSLSNPQGKHITPPPEKQDKAFQFFTDSKFAAQVRSYYFYRDKFDDSISEAWTLGGSLSWKSGYAMDVFAVGAVGYTSYQLYAPSDRDGTTLLLPGQDGFSVLGQIYGEFKITDRIFAAVGRKEYNTPYVNKNDTRMVPNTFEGATVYGTAGSKDGGKTDPAIRFGAGYLDKIKERNDDGFIWMSHDAGSSAERGVVLGGANVDWKGWSFGAIDYYCADVINIFYTEGKATFFRGQDHELRLSAQWTDQRSDGDNRLTGDDFGTDQFGVKADFAVGDFLLTLAYTFVTDGANIRSPWGGYPGYTSVQVEDFFRAGEQAAMARVGYDLSNLGLKGVSTYGLWVHGWGVEDPNFNEDEFDANLQWAAAKGSALNGLSVRVRYAYVAQDGGGDPDISEVRVIVNYDVPFPIFR
jgi:hypothetical protein